MTLVNYTIGTRHGTALLAGLFLLEFVPPEREHGHVVPDPRWR